MDATCSVNPGGLYCMEHGWGPCLCFARTKGFVLEWPLCSRDMLGRPRPLTASVPTFPSYLHTSQLVAPGRIQQAIDALVASGVALVDIEVVVQQHVVLVRQRRAADRPEI